jgi:hypothetical protein
MLLKCLEGGWGDEVKCNDVSLARETRGDSLSNCSDHLSAIPLFLAATNYLGNNIYGIALPASETRGSYH